MSADRGRLDGRGGGRVDEHLAPVRPQVVAPLPRRGGRRARGSIESTASCPHQTPARVERRIVALRQSRKLGPARLAGIVGVPASTVHRVLVRHGVNRLRWMDRADRSVDPPDRDQPLRRAGPHRRQETGPGPRRRRLASSRSDAARPTQRHTEPGRLHPHPHRHRRLLAGSPTASSPASRTPSTASRSCTEPSPGSPSTASRSNGSSPTTATATAAAPGGPLRRARHHAHPHPALPARHQRQGRTLQPHPARRMGLRPTLEIRTQPTHPRP